MSHDPGRTEPATPKRREEFRERGEIAKSRDLAGAIVLLASLGALAMCGEALASEMRTGLRDALSALGDLRTRDPLEAAKGPIWGMARAAAPVLFAALVGGIGAHFGQSGLLFTTKALAPNFGRLAS